MKNLLVGFLLVVLTGCGAYVEFDEQYSFVGTDFGKYSEKGFLFTPEGYNGEYESVGMFSVKHTPSYKEIEDIERLPKRTFVMGEFNIESTIDYFYVYATERGADAIINLTTMEDQIIIEGKITPRITISGFAIKRLDKK